MKLRIDPELRDLLRAHTPQEAIDFQEGLATYGTRDPIEAWSAPEGLTLLDGHNRDAFFRANPHLPYPRVEIVDLPDLAAAKAYILKKQVGQRTLTEDQRLVADLRAGRTTPALSPIKISTAKALLAKAPKLAAAVEAGHRTLAQARSDFFKDSAPPAPAPKPRQVKAPKGRIHVVIGDTQTKPGVPTAHLRWIGQYIVDQFTGTDLAIVHLGDHWDMPSLSTYDVGKKAIEGRRYSADIEAGNAAMRILNEPIAKEMARIKWTPERHLLLGNHENRIQRACNDVAHLDGKLSLDDLDLCGWTRHDYLKPLVLDGISYSHFFYHPNTGRPYSGENLYPRLKTIGRSFTMGHQQGLQYALRPVGEARHQGLVLGSSYLHDEEYLGPQGTAYWRGIVVCHQVEHGQYDPMFVSLDYLCRRYERETLATFMKGKAA